MTTNELGRFLHIISCNPAASVASASDCLGAEFYKAGTDELNASSNGSHDLAEAFYIMQQC